MMTKANFSDGITICNSPKLIIPQHIFAAIFGNAASKADWMALAVNRTGIIEKISEDEIIIADKERR